MNSLLHITVTVTIFFWGGVAAYISMHIIKMIAVKGVCYIFFGGRANNKFGATSPPMLRAGSYLKR